jgi:nucleoid DNA-binding protein
MNKEYNLSDLVADLVADPIVPIMDPEAIEAVLKAAFRHTAKRVARDGRIEYQGFGVIDLVPRIGRSGLLFGDNQEPWSVGPYYEMVYNPDPKFLKIANEFKNPDFAKIPVKR